MGLVACCLLLGVACLLLLARRASYTLVSNNLINRLKYYVLQLGDPYPYPYRWPGVRTDGPPEDGGLAHGDGGLGPHAQHEGVQRHEEAPAADAGPGGQGPQEQDRRGAHHQRPGGWGAREGSVTRASMGYSLGY